MRYKYVLNTYLTSTCSTGRYCCVTPWKKKKYPSLVVHWESWRQENDKSVKNGAYFEFSLLYNSNFVNFVKNDDELNLSSVGFVTFDKLMIVIMVVMVMMVVM